MITTDRKPTDNTVKNSWGMRFQAARIAMNLSEKDAAARLHLKPHIISIIESERFAEGPPVIFMRGYIRSYGRLLNFTEKDLNQALAQLDFGSITPPPVPNQFRLPENNHSSFSVWSTAFVMLVLAGLVGTWWWNSHTHTAPVVADATQSNEVVHAQDSGVAITAPDTINNLPAAAPAQASAPVEAATPVTAPANADTAAAVEPKVAEVNPSATASIPTTTPTATTAPAANETVAQAAQTAAPVDANSTLTAPAVSGNADSAAEQTTTPSPTVADNDNDNNDAEDLPPAPSKTHTEKHKLPPLADSEMSVPEPGLENETSE